MPSPPWRAALALVSRTASNRDGSGGVQASGADREERRDDRLQPHRPRPRRGLVGAGLGADDQHLHGENIARKRRAGFRQQPLGQRGGLALAGAHLAAVGAEDFRPQPPVPRQGGDRGMAIAPQSGEEGALGIDRFMGGMMVDRGEQRAQVGAFGQDLDADRALRRGGEQIDGHAGGDAEPVEPGGGEQGGVDLAAFDLGQAGLDIAADRQRVKIGPPRQQLRRPPRRRGADPRALGQRRDAVGADQPVACVGRAPASPRSRTGRAGSSRRPSSNGPKGRCGPRRGRRRAPWSTAPCRRPRRAAGPG